MLSTALRLPSSLAAVYARVAVPFPGRQHQARGGGQGAATVQMPGSMTAIQYLRPCLRLLSVFSPAMRRRLPLMGSRRCLALVRLKIVRPAYPGLRDMFRTVHGDHARAV